MPEKNNKHHEGYIHHCPDCGMHHGYYHRDFFLRWLVGIIILLVVFWLGIKIGEFKGYFGSDGYYGYCRMPMMYPYNYDRWCYPLWYNNTQSGQAQTQTSPSITK